MQTNEITESDILRSDLAAKNAVANKGVIATIVMENDGRYSDMGIQEVMDLVQPVGSERPAESNPGIAVSGSEYVVLDSVFRIRSPDGDPAGGALVNIDIQGQEPGGLEFCNRQHVYPAAMLLDQIRVRGKVEYPTLQRCYSVWMIPHPHAEFRNRTDTYGLVRKKDPESGEGPYWDSHINVVSYRLGDPSEETDSRSLRLANLIFSGDISVDERRRRIKDEFGFDIGLSTLEEVKKSMSMTAEYGIARYSEGRTDGREEGREERNIEIAKNLLGEDLSDEFVSRNTGLDIERVRQLRTEL